MTYMTGPKRASARRSGRESKRTTGHQSYVEVVGTGERIPVPDDAAGERAAVVAHPIYQARRKRALRATAEGRATSFDELRRKLDAEEAAERPGRSVRPAEERRPRPRGPRPTSASGKVLLRLPLSVHRELIERAEAERTSLNQLALAYISRGLGEDAKSA